MMLTGLYKKQMNPGLTLLVISLITIIKSQENLMFSKTAGNFMTKATAVVATLFIICSLALTIVSRGELSPTSSVLDTVEEKTEDTPSIPEDN